MSYAANLHNPARSWCGATIFRAETPPTAAPEHLSHPLSPRNPLFPASGPATGSFNGPHLKSKFLAIAIHETGYSGHLSIECEGQGGPLLTKSLHWLRNTLAELGIPEEP
jgi:hypothetical protein